VQMVYLLDGVLTQIRFSLMYTVESSENLLSAEFYSYARDTDYYNVPFLLIHS
jgi:hypothetical protein